jgi:hypothetical protein
VVDHVGRPCTQYADGGYCRAHTTALAAARRGDEESGSVETCIVHTIAVITIVACIAVWWYR